MHFYGKGGQEDFKVRLADNLKKKKSSFPEATEKVHLHMITEVVTT